MQNFFAEKKLQRRGKKFVMFFCCCCCSSRRSWRHQAVSGHKWVWSSRWMMVVCFCEKPKLHSSESCVKENLGIDRPQWRHQCINVSLAALGSVVEWNWASNNQDSYGSILGTGFESCLLTFFLRITLHCYLSNNRVKLALLDWKPNKTLLVIKAKYH